MSLTTKVKVAKFSFLNEKSYNKTVIDFNFVRHKDLSTLKSDIHLDLVSSVNYHFFGWINPYVYLIVVNNCIMLPTVCASDAITNKTRMLSQWGAIASPHAQVFDPQHPQV